MCGISFHASFIQLFSQRNQPGLFQRSQDCFISCNHSVTESALSSDRDFQVHGTRGGSPLHRPDLPVKAKQAGSPPWYGGRSGKGGRTVFHYHGGFVVDNSPSKGRPKQATGGDPADLTSANYQQGGGS
jgi:hypothetical protein